MTVTTSGISTTPQAASADRTDSSILAPKASASDVVFAPVTSLSFPSPLHDIYMRWDDLDLETACEEVVDDELSDDGMSA